MASKMTPYTHGPNRKPQTEYWSLDPMKRGKPPVKVKPKAKKK
jgi:hypothetical protein